MRPVDAAGTKVVGKFLMTEDSSTLGTGRPGQGEGAMPLHHPSSRTPASVAIEAARAPRGGKVARPSPPSRSKT